MELLNARENSFLFPVQLFPVSADLKTIDAICFFTEHRVQIPSDSYTSYIAVFLSVSSHRNMSQARVTDFFSQRKKGIAAPVKPPKHRSGVLGHGSSAISDNVPCTRSLSSIKKDNLLSLPSVHEEFVRVIDEAVGLNEGKPGVDIEDSTTRPRTPKRTSAEFDLGAAVFSATANHSTAKKSRQVEVVAGVEANTLGRVTRKKARKKLILPQDSSQVLVECIYKDSPFVEI